MRIYYGPCPAQVLLLRASLGAWQWVPVIVAEQAARRWRPATTESEPGQYAMFFSVPAMLKCATYVFAFRSETWRPQGASGCQL